MANENEVDNREAGLMRHPKRDLVHKLMNAQDYLKFIKDKADDDYRELADELKGAKRKLLNVVDERDSFQKGLDVQVEHLDNIRKAIETIAAMKYPGTEFDVSLHATLVPTGYVKAEEPEELLYLRHLYSLTGF